MSNMEKEIWKAIKGYEGLYEVSNLGNVRSLDRIDRINHFWKGNMLKLKNDKGYYRATLCKDGNKKMFFIHRLVAEAFILNPNNYPIINHKDENPLNNRVENLEWCTHQYNSNYGTCIERRAEKTSKPILQFSLSGEFIKEYPSAEEAAKQLSIYKQNICKVLKGKRKKCGGYVWKYKEQG